MPTPFRIHPEGPEIPEWLDRGRVEADRALLEGWYGATLETLESRLYGRAFARVHFGEDRVYTLNHAALGRWLREQYGLRPEPQDAAQEITSGEN